MPSSSAYPGLNRAPGKSDNWVEKAGGLPSYIERIAKHLHYEKGKDIGTAIAIAVNTVKRWAKGTNHNGSKLKPETVAKAAAAVAEWEAKKAKGKLKETVDTDVELTSDLAPSLVGACAHRLTLAEGLAEHLRGKRTGGKAGAVESAKALIEGAAPRMTLNRGNASADELARTQSKLGVEISILRTIVEAVTAADSSFTAKQGQQQKVKAKGRNGQAVFDESQHPRAGKGRTGGGQFVRAGSSGPAVKGIQRKLGVKEDGQFGKKTEQAVRDYQEAHGLDVDGVVGSQTAAALRGAEAVPGPLLGHHTKDLQGLKNPGAADRYSKAHLASADAAEKAKNQRRKVAKEAREDAKDGSSSSSSSDSTPTTGKGSVFDGASSLPKRVIDLIQRKLGLDTSGGYDEKTKARIEAFQKEHGLAVDGIVGTQTLAALRGDETPPEPGGFSQSDWDWLTQNQSGGQRRKRSAKQKKGREEREEKREARVEKQLSEAQEKESKGEKKPVVEDDHARSYGAGMAGAPDEATAHLQRRLGELGYDAGPDDGRYGERTKSAVEGFQADHSLKEDGAVGPNTKVALRGTDPDEVSRRRTSSKPEPEAEEPESEEEAPEESPAGEAPEAEAPDVEDQAPAEEPPRPKLAGAVLTKGAGTDSDDPDPSVAAMQKAIGSDEDGWFGPATEKKLKSTQRKYGLKADGVVGPKTGRLLDRLNAKHDTEAAPEDKALEEAVLDRMAAAVAGDSVAFIRARGRERHLREASLRDSAKDLLRDFKRLDDGTFAPKGLGRVLKPGEQINIPHKGGKKTVTAKVEGSHKGRGIARLTNGPDKGRLVSVRTAAPDTRKAKPFPKKLDSKPAGFPKLPRDGAGWGDRHPSDKLNAEAAAQSHLDQMNHYIDQGDHQGVQDYYDDANGEADFAHDHNGAGALWDEVEERGNKFLSGDMDWEATDRPTDYGPDAAPKGTAIRTTNEDGTFKYGEVVEFDHDPPGSYVVKMPDGQTESWGYGEEVETAGHPNPDTPKRWESSERTEVRKKGTEQADDKRRSDDAEKARTAESDKASAKRAGLRVEPQAGGLFAVVDQEGQRVGEMRTSKESAGKDLKALSGSRDPMKAPAEGDEGAQLDAEFDEAMADPQRAPIDFTSLSDADLDKAMDEATSHLEGRPMTAKDRGVFTAVTKEQGRRAKKQFDSAQSAPEKSKLASLVEQFTGKRPAGVPAPQMAPPEGFKPNASEVQIKDMKPGDTFYVAKYDSPFVLHKKVGGDFWVAKPVGGGKAKPFHEQQAPVFIGPHDDTYPGGDGGGKQADATNPDDGGDLYEKLKASVDAAGGSKPKSVADEVAQKESVASGKAEDMDDPVANAAQEPGVGADKVQKGKTASEVIAAYQNSVASGNVDHGDGDLSESPARSAKGNLRNFKAMSDKKLTGLAQDMKDHPYDTEAVEAIKAELDKRTGAFLGNSLPGSKTNPTAPEPKSTSKKLDELEAAADAPGATAEDDEKLAQAYEKAAASMDEPKPSVPKTHEPAKNKSVEEKLASAWAAYDAKKAEFDALPKDAPKAERSKKAAQVRAAKFRIKRVGGNDAFDKGPPAGEDKSAAKAPSKPATPPPGEHLAADLEEGQHVKMPSGEVYKVIDHNPEEDMVTLEASDGIQHAVVGNAVFKDEQLIDAPEEPELGPGDPGYEVFLETLEKGDWFKKGPNDDLWQVMETSPQGVTVWSPIDDEVQMWSPESEVEEAEAPDPASVGGEYENLSNAVSKLGEGWDYSTVEAALDQLDSQGITFDREQESPDTIAAVIKAAGLDPANLKTQGTV